MNARRRFVLLTMVGAACIAGLSACSVGPDFLSPAAPAAAGYIAGTPLRETTAASVAGGAAQRFVQGKDVPGQWWELFRSKELDALIEEALMANPDVAAAQAALRQAREIAFADEGALLPTVSASGSDTREKISGASIGQPGYSPLLTVSSASLNVSYAPDVFGGVRRQAESGSAQADYERFQLEATYLTLTSNVVNAAVTMASVRDQIKATEDIIKIDSNQLDIVKQRFAEGAVSQADVLTQQSTLAQTIATLPPLQKQLAQARNQLMALVGRFPSQFQGENFALASLALPQKLPVILPSELIEQRPDVRAAEAQMHEASANVGVAIANQLPQFTITGQLGTTAASLDKLFSPETAVWSIAGAVTQTVFDAGALEHRKRAAQAAYNQSEAQYRKTVLAAFQDVANALRALQADADALKAQSLAEKSAFDSLDLVRRQYRLGSIDHITLLNAEQTYQNAVINRVRAQAARYSDTVALFQALGGGWWNRRDVSPASEVKPDRFALPPFQEIKLSVPR